MSFPSLWDHASNTYVLKDFFAIKFRCFHPTQCFLVPPAWAGLCAAWRQPWLAESLGSACLLVKQKYANSFSPSAQKGISGNKTSQGQVPGGQERHCLPSLSSLICCHPQLAFLNFGLMAQEAKYTLRSGNSLSLEAPSSMTIVRSLLFRLSSLSWKMGCFESYCGEKTREGDCST